MSQTGTLNDHSSIVWHFSLNLELKPKPSPKLLTHRAPNWKIQILDLRSDPHGLEEYEKSQFKDCHLRSHNPDQVGSGYRKGSQEGSQLRE